MHAAAIKGDWDAARKLVREDPSLRCTALTYGGDTALHIAALAKHVNFVRQLVCLLDTGDMLIVNRLGYTPLVYAAIAGEVEIAKLMVCKNSHLVSYESTDSYRNPLCVAAFSKKKEMAWYLFSVTAAEDLPVEVWSYVLLATVQSSMPDLAREILSRIRNVRISEDIMKLLRRLALHYDLPGQSTEAGFLDAILEAINYLPWFRSPFQRHLIRRKQRRNALLLVEMLWGEILNLNEPNLEELLKDPPILHDSARVGNTGLLTMITHTDPQLILTVDDNDHSVFHIAISERQDDVFSLIYQIGPMTEVISLYPDKDGNNMMHLAAKLAPHHRLSIVSAAALQLQREILWFKRVEEVVSPICLEMKNRDGLQPRELFSIEHRHLFSDGEIWMKETSNSSMVVATLVATMAFAAGITVPGGNNDETGIPVFSNSSWFRIFMVSNTTTMFCSTTSIILFLSIHVSRYDENDFAVALPTKLMLGFLMIFISIVGALFAFTSTFVLVNESYNPSASRWVLVGVCAMLIVIFVCVLCLSLYLSLGITNISPTPFV